MKTKKIGVFLLLTIVLTLGLFPMSVFAEQTIVTPNSTASIKVTNAVKDDVLAAYKVIDITYDTGTNHLTYAWNSDFAEYFEGTNSSYNSTAYTVEKFAELENNSDALKTLLANLPKYIKDNNITATATATVGADGTATFADLEMGEYFIRPTTTTSVYQLMLQKIEPTVGAVTGSSGNSVYVIDNVTFDAKKNEVNITKTADKTSVTKNEKVTYTITVDIPTYSTGATDKTFYIADLLSDGLTLDTDSIKVQIDGVDVGNTTYTLDTTATADYTFKLSVDNNNYATYWINNAGKQLVITYSATFNDDATTTVNTPESNTATFDYSHYPYVDSNSHEQKTDNVEVNTFAIKIDKYASKTDANDKSQKLAGAIFDLYRTATQEEIDADKTVAQENKKVVTIPHTSVQGIKLEFDIVTDENGVATFSKYEANGTNYTYYLVETQAPTGYNILTEAVKVNFTDTDVAGEKKGIYTVQVPNSSGITLPITGGEGVVLFTVLGIAFMSGAVFLFIISRKKSNTNYKR